MDRNNGSTGGENCEPCAEDSGETEDSGNWAGYEKFGEAVYRAGSEAAGNRTIDTGCDATGKKNG